MISRYLFDAAVCNPAVGWEKGQAEKNTRMHDEDFGSRNQSNLHYSIRCSTARSQALTWHYDRLAPIPFRFIIHNPMLFRYARYSI